MTDLSSSQTVSAATQNMNGNKAASSLCCRRRTLTNKILPAAIQAFVVLAAWEVIKSLVPSSHRNVVFNSARSIDQSKCPASEISQATTLSLLDLSSIISEAEFPTRDRTLTYHLKANVYVRNEKQSSFVMYPFGTLVNLGNFKTKFADDNRAVDKVQSLAVDIDSKDDSSFNSIDTSIGKSTTPSTLSQIAFDYPPQNFNPQIGNKGGIKKTDNTNQASRLQPETARGVFGSRGRVKSELTANSARSPQEILLQDIFNRKAQLTSNSQRNDSVKMSIKKSPSDPYHYLKVMDQNIINRMANDDVTGLTEAQLQNPLGVDQEFINNDPFSSAGKLHSKGLLIDETGERLYAEGFLDRVKKITAEMFGASTDGSVVETPIHVLMNSPDVCRDFSDIDVVFLINSIPENAEQRQHIRDTFVNPSFFPDFKFAHVFLIGKAKTPNFQQMLNEEQSMHQDIVQGDFIDIPDSGSLKGIMGMRWVTHFCTVAKYVMKIHDGVFVDTDKLIRGLIPTAKRISGKRVIFCYFQSESSLTRDGPNAISQDLFPGRSRLRPYCRGFAILLTSGVVSSLVAASDFVKPINMEELYLYGILPFVSGNIDVYDIGASRALHNFGVETVNCYKSLQDKCPFVASIAYNGRFDDLWDFVLARMQKPHPDWEFDRSLWNILNFKRRF